ncbi:polyprenyl synthetase family protein [Desulfomonile tiedjei]|uniref:Geranylgeranyl pyrophosphate synthase n=1 Tax=Desulfomonile tiedjei (strain ATCC 49306 / DSM 6799 / DCB-1) TaxID=706587 RepID=I4C8A3_DESTA|nr:polyprenyl synthetase family protein [Desulfomonile tiedjei]AFM25794.1 geranylgeranyl pyrophosphate synthase [Desulfomonile tiedjei DSM 6799]
MDLLESIQSDMQKLENELIEHLESRVPVAFEIGAHIMNSGGKRIRPQLAIIAARMGGYTGLNALKLSGAIECIHTATLLHDDVVDDADTRRGRPSANTLWSNEMCVLGGDFILAKAFSALTSIGNLRILEIVSAATERLSEGELFQMANIGNLDLTEADYLQVITDKTAVLMEAACRGGAILGNFEPNKEEALAQFGLNLGIAFQMTDDVIDYRSDVQTMGKPQCKDIQEGKLTLPLIAALRNATAPERNRVEKMIEEKTLSGDDQVWIRNWVERTGGIQQTLESGRAFLEKGTAHLEIFPDTEEKRALMKLAERILHRTY